MSDTSTTDDQQPDTPAGLRAAHAAEKEGRTAAESEAAKLRKENLFLKAGITIDDDGAGQLLFDAWSGGDDLEALKAKALKVGALKQSGEQTDPPPTPEQQQQQQMGDLMRGGASTTAGAPSEGPDPSVEMLRQYHDAKARGETDQTARFEGLSSFLKAAQKGDPRTRFNQAEHAAAADAYDSSSI